MILEFIRNVKSKPSQIDQIKFLNNLKVSMENVIHVYEIIKNNDMKTERHVNCISSVISKKAFEKGLFIISFGNSVIFKSFSEIFENTVVAELEG